MGRTLIGANGSMSLQDDLVYIDVEDETPEQEPILQLAVTQAVFFAWMLQGEGIREEIKRRNATTYIATLPRGRKK